MPEVFEDFLGASGATLPAPWGEQDTSSAGSPVTAYVNGRLNGAYELTHDTQDEAQMMSLYWSDQLMIDPTQNPYFEARVNIATDGSTLSANQRVVFGLASARNATLDSITHHCWFRVEGASLVVKVEGDDGTTDTNDQATDFSYTNDTYHVYKIDMSDLSNVRFVFDGQDCGSVDVSAMTSSNGLQPFIEIQKDGDAEEDSIEVDYVKVSWDRV